MDEIRALEFGDAGGLPAVLRARLRRRRHVRRARAMGGAALVASLFAAAGVLVVVPVEDDSVPQGMRDGAVISIDDPMFDSLDWRGESGGDLTRWRAGARLEDVWLLEL